MTENDKLSEEEYKQIFGLTITIEERLMRIFLVSVAVSVSLLSATAGLIFSGKIPSEFEKWAMYIFLIPNMITMPAFNLILAQRIDLARAAAYQMVFYEESGTYAGWVRRLKVLRKNIVGPESFDTIPLTYWSILIVSAIAFITYVLAKNLCYFHFAILPVFAIIFVKLNISWGGKTRINYVSEWKNVLEQETHNKAISADAKSRAAE